MALAAEECRVPAARHFACALLTCWGVAEDDRDSAALIVSELVGNAARHGRADMALTLLLSDRDLCIEVVDSGARDEHPRPPHPGGECGRGLAIVECLAEWMDVREARSRRSTRAGLRLTPHPACAAA
ncbi:ATP-binding protein [Streptomyces rhizosphaericus]|uniref:ATP-binding protein n=1 Tax=Streptomyces rhizosphaericus TaxID=114699 RepID=UPI002892EB58|nr:ATP-binding protein [Streptomyces rhizosphaericus]